MPTRPAYRDDELLCERCGYPLEGLGEADRCPECGESIARSRPEYRTGSAFQNRPGARSWGVTTLAMLRSPRETTRRMRVDAERWMTLLWANLALAAVVVALPLVAPLVLALSRTFPGTVRTDNRWHVTLVGTACVAGLLALLWALTWIERVGVMFFARRRGHRLTRTAAWQICAHASVGWLLCGVLPITYLAVAYAFDLWRDWAVAAATAASYATGLLVFETLVWVGATQCMFANAPGAGEKPGDGKTSSAHGAT